jgi:hypothetical protein
MVMEGEASLRDDRAVPAIIAQEPRAGLWRAACRP